MQTNINLFEEQTDDEKLYIKININTRQIKKW